MVGEVEAVDFEGSTFYQLNKATLVPLADFLADAHLGNYAICAVASTGEYDGSFTSGRIELFQGYEVEVAAKEFITYYKDEPLYVEDEAAELYTIESVNGDQAVPPCQATRQCWFITRAMRRRSSSSSHAPSPTWPSL